MCFFRLFKRRNKKAETPAPEKELPVTEEMSANPQKENAEPVTEEVSVKEREVAVQPVTEAEEAAPEKAVPRPAEPKKVQVVKAPEGKVLVRVRYNRSYTARLIQSDDKLKNYYGEIRNELMRYKVKPRISWRYETFKTGRKLLAKLAIRGKTLNAYFALDPASYAGTKYKIDDVSRVSKNASVPTLYKLKNDRRVKYCKDLIADLMQKNGLEAGEAKKEDYAAIYPYEKIEPLIERGLVKLLKWKEASDFEEAVIEVTAEQYEEIAAADNHYAEAVEESVAAVPEVVESITVVEAEEKIADEVVETFVEESQRLSDRTRKDIVNIDALGRYFNAGEDVTIEEIRKRVPSVNKKATYIKVLARGRLDKALNIEADDFSPAAIKMIVLTGGSVKRTKNSV